MTPDELKELYRSKFISLDQALDTVRSGDVIATGSYGNEPVTLLRNLHRVAERGVDELTVWMGIPAEEYPFVSDDSLTGIHILSIFYARRFASTMARAASRSCRTTCTPCPTSSSTAASRTYSSPPSRRWTSTAACACP